MPSLGVFRSPLVRFTSIIGRDVQGVRRTWRPRNHAWSAGSRPDGGKGHWHLRSARRGAAYRGGQRRDAGTLVRRGSNGRSYIVARLRAAAPPPAAGPGRDFAHLGPETFAMIG
jgi:hypothetical protein